MPFSTIYLTESLKQWNRLFGLVVCSLSCNQPSNSYIRSPFNYVCNKTVWKYAFALPWLLENPKQNSKISIHFALKHSQTAYTPITQKYLTKSRTMTLTFHCENLLFFTACEIRSNTTFVLTLFCISISVQQCVDTSMRLFFFWFILSFFFLLFLLFFLLSFCGILKHFFLVDFPSVSFTRMVLFYTAGCVIFFFCCHA